MRGFKNLRAMAVFWASFEAVYRYFRMLRPLNRDARARYAERLAEFAELTQERSAA